LLEIKDLSYTISDDAGTADILKKINLTVPDNQFVVITGPNGSGKTTLAKAIMGLVETTQGSISWNGEELSGMGITERAKRGVIYGFQQPPRFKGLTVQDLLDLSVGGKLAHGEACNLLTRVGLCANDYINREVNASLSGGEVKRIEIATLLARNASLLILDEPEAGIDLWSFAKLTETFEELRSAHNATVIIISHQERIINMADRVLLLAGGEIVGDGTPKEVMPQIAGTILFTCDALLQNRGE